MTCRLPETSRIDTARNVTFSTTPKLPRNETIQTGLFLRDCSDHVLQVLDVLESYRDLASGLMETYLSVQSHRMNEVMKVLTIIATIFIPLTFVAGIYGMNFDAATSPWNMPELHWYWGYPFSLGLMAVLAILLLIFFRRKDWL